MKTRLDAEKENHHMELKHMDQQKENVLARKREKDAIKGKLDSIQTEYNRLMKRIQDKRDKILTLQKKQAEIETKKQEKLEQKNQQIRQLQVKLKKQMFFIQNLIPKSFIGQLGSSQVSSGENDGKWAVSGHSIHNLRKPLSIHTYEMEDSYLCPYPLKFSKKNGKKESENGQGYPELADVLRDGRRD